MKKIFLSIAAVAFIFGATLLTSCSKDDTTKPVITLVGGDETVSLNGTYTDKGATAEDDTDGDLTSSIATDNPVNVNIKGVYTVTYTVSDAAGNTATETRKVTVKNDKENMAGNYTVNGTYDGSPDLLYTTETVSASSTINNRIIFANFAAFDGAAVYANVSGTTITIPSQTITCGNPPLTLTFVGTGTVTSASSFAVAGTLVDASAPTVTVPWSYTFTMQ
jgi:hypothetical protein